MRKQASLFYLAAMIIISSVFLSDCSKKPSITPAVLTTFKFTVNGTVYNWDGNLADSSYGSRLGKTTYNGVTWWDLAALPVNGGIYRGIYLRINATTLSATSYTLTTTATTLWTVAEHLCMVPSVICASSEVGDYATIIISSIHDGYADGTFTARLTNTDGTLAKVDVIAGEFHNVKLAQ
jgi:hypothetical protein